MKLERANNAVTASIRHDHCSVAPPELNPSQHVMQAAGHSGAAVTAT